MADNKVVIEYSLKDSASNGIKTLSENFSSMAAKGAVATAAISAIGYGLGKLIESAEESRKIMAQTETVLESTGNVSGVSAEQVVKLSESLSKLTNYSHEEIQSAENLILTFTKVGKEIFPQTTEAVLDMSTALGQDLKSSSIQLGKALQDPIIGLTALRRVGVAFTDSQKDQIKVLVDSGRELEAQKIILSEIQKEFGGSAKAQASALTILKNQFSLLGEEIGSVFLPAVSSAAGGVIKLIDTFKKLDMQEFIRWFFQGTEAAKTYREEMKKLSDDAEKAGVGKPIKFQKSDSYAKELKDDIEKSKKIINDYYADLIKLKSEETSAKNIMYRQDYENHVQVLRDNIAAEKNNLETSKNTLSDYNKQIDSQRKSGEDKTVESYDMIMKKHEVLTSKLEADGDYTITKEIAQLEKIKAAHNYTTEQGLELEKKINELRLKNNEKTFDDILKAHKTLSENEKINNTYTYKQEIIELQSVLDNHKLTEEQKYKITTAINALTLADHVDTSKKIVDSAFYRLDQAKKIGDASVLSEILNNQKILESDQLTTDDRINLEKRLNDERKLASDKYGKSYIDAIVALSDKEWSIKHKLAQGTLDFAKQAILKEVDARAAGYAAKIIGEGLAAAIPTFGVSLAVAAAEVVALGAAVATAHAAVGSIQLAQGGIVNPRNGGVNATIGEGGSREAVVPLDTMRGKEALGMGGGTLQVMLSGDGFNILAKAMWIKQSDMLRTGEITDRRR